MPNEVTDLPSGPSFVWYGMGVAITILAVVLGWSIYDSYDETLEREFRELETQARLGEVQISASLRSLDLILRSVIDDALMEPKIPENVAKQRKLNWLTQFPEIYLIGQTDAHGRVSSLDSLDKNDAFTRFAHFDASKREYFTAHVHAKPSEGARIHISRPFTTIVGLKTIAISKAIRGKKGEFRGVALIVLSPSYFESVLRQVLSHEVLDAAALHNRQGDIIFRLPDPEKYIGKNIATGEAFRRYLASDHPMTRFTGVTVTDNVRRLLVFSRVDESELDIGVSGRYDVIMRSWYRSLYWKALIFVTGFLLCIALGREMRRRIREQDVASATIQKLAFNDALTNLPNRRLLRERLEQAMLSGQRSNRYGALLFMDLDSLKPLNDQHGHSAGDALLKQVAERLLVSVRAMDTVARLGGDEFVVLLRDLDADLVASRSQAAVVAEKIRARLSEPCVLQVTDKADRRKSIEHSTSVSIGVVVFLGQELGEDEILRHADDAMYQAKAAGKNTVRFYEFPAAN